MDLQSNLMSATALECQASLFNLTNKLDRHQNFTIEDVGDLLPGSVMVQDLGSLTNTYMNGTGCRFLRRSSEELKALGADYFDSFFPPDEVALLKAELKNFIAQQDFSKVFSFYQRVRPNKNAEYKWFLTSSRLYQNQYTDGRTKILNIAINVSDLNLAEKNINHICEPDIQIKKHYANYLLLSPREKEVIRLIANGKSSYMIADILYISPHTVNNHRKNILAKLQVKSISELIRIALAFSII